MKFFNKSQSDDPETAPATMKNDEEAGVKGSSPDQQLRSPPKHHHFGPIIIPAFHSTLGQTIHCGFICFLVVGMHAVLVYLGGGGQLDATLSDNCNTILYAVFAFMSLFTGSLVNYFGIKIGLIIGSLGYALYGGAFWSYNHNHNSGFVLFSGAACGFSAAFLWTSQGSLIMSYPTEREKGRFISLFFAIYSMGSIIGGIVPTVQNWGNTSAGHVTDGTYAAMTMLMASGALVALCLVHPSKIVRSNGTPVVVVKHASLMQEMKNAWIVVKKEPYIWFFFPYAFCGSWYLSYQTSDYNSYFFDVRTRSLNSLLYSIAQFFGSIALGLICDLPWFHLKRRTRAFLAWGATFFSLNVILICGYFPMAESYRGKTHTVLDVMQPTTAKYVALYFFYGFQDGMLQTFSYWIMGTLSNDPTVLALYGSFYKLLASVGVAINFDLDARKYPYETLFLTYWILLGSSLLIMLPLVYKRITNGMEDGTMDAIAGGGVESAMGIGIDREVEAEKQIELSQVKN